MSDFDAVALKIQALSRDLDGAGLRRITTAVSVEAKKDVDTEVVHDLGSDRKFRNWKVKFGSGFKITSNTTSVLTPRPLGPWHVLEEGRKGKAAAFPKGRRKRKVYNTPWGLRTASNAKPWRSGPTRGHHTFSHASAVIRRETGQRVDKETTKMIARHFTKTG